MASSARRERRALRVFYPDRALVYGREPGHYLRLGYGLIPGGMPSARAGGQAPHHMLCPAIKEIRDGVAARAGSIDHAMRRRQEAVVGPAAEQVTAVDEKRTLDRRRIDPASAWQPHRQPR